jgi:hypothetical protein
MYTVYTYKCMVLANPTHKHSFGILMCPYAAPVSIGELQASHPENGRHHRIPVRQAPRH